jgi:hypothetical protein
MSKYSELDFEALISTPLESAKGTQHLKWSAPEGIDVPLIQERVSDDALPHLISGAGSAPSLCQYVCNKTLDHSAIRGV